MGRADSSCYLEIVKMKHTHKHLRRAAPVFRHIFFQCPTCNKLTFTFDYSTPGPAYTYICSTRCMLCNAAIHVVDDLDRCSRCRYRISCLSVGLDKFTSVIASAFNCRDDLDIVIEVLNQIREGVEEDNRLAERTNSGRN